MEGTQVIFSADDFGRSSEINQAIAMAHRRGTLTSASLMIAGAAAQEAVELARDMPDLAVGLHLVIVDGRSVLRSPVIPHLVDRDGNFSRNPTIAGFRYFFRPAARSELEMEINAQFERYAETGLAMSHVDGHCHMHLHPVVLKIVIPLAKRYGAKGIRIVRDDLRLAIEFDRRGRIEKALRVISLGLLSRCAARRICRAGLATVRRTYGAANSGCMSEDYLLDLLDRLNDSPVEIYFHPTTGARLDRLGPNGGDLQALLSDEVKRRIESRGLQLTNYALLAARQVQPC